jgi:hypothetical protein
MVLQQSVAGLSSLLEQCIRHLSIVHPPAPLSFTYTFSRVQHVFVFLKCELCMLSFFPMVEAAAMLLLFHIIIYNTY